MQRYIHHVDEGTKRSGYVYPLLIGDNNSTAITAQALRRRSSNTLLSYVAGDVLSNVVIHARWSPTDIITCRWYCTVSFADEGTDANRTWRILYWGSMFQTVTRPDPAVEEFPQSRIFDWGFCRSDVGQSHFRKCWPFATYRFCILKNLLVDFVGKKCSFPRPQPTLESFSMVSPLAQPLSSELGQDILGVKWNKSVYCNHCWVIGSCMCTSK